MGILDDAIREHLELKRSHGATDDEIRSKEAEVFGSVRAAEAQAAAEAAPAADEHTQLLSPESAPDLEDLQPAPEDPYQVHPGDELVPDPDDVEEPAEEHLEPQAEAGAQMLEPHRVDPGPPTGPVHHHLDEEHPALADRDHIGGEEHAPEPVFGHAPEAPVTPPPAHLDEPTQAYQVPLDDEEDEEEDVLEETPEFLQDAPEHDRLWFEQKPPRDFDFGE